MWDRFIAKSVRAKGVGTKGARPKRARPKQVGLKRVTPKSVEPKGVRAKTVLMTTASAKGGGVGVSRTMKRRQIKVRYCPLSLYLFGKYLVCNDFGSFVVYKLMWPLNHLAGVLSSI